MSAQSFLLIDVMYEENTQLTDSPKTNDGRHHVQSMLMRESLLDKDVQKSTETPVFRMLPEAHVIKIGGRSVMDAGRAVVYPVVEALAGGLKTKKLIIGTGGGARSRHVLVRAAMRIARVEYHI